MLIPDAINTIFEPQRDFAYARIPAQSKGVKNICAINRYVKIIYKYLE